MLKQEAEMKKAFEWIVRLNKELVYFHVRRMVVCHDDANDVTQNTLIKAWKGLVNFRAESKISTWLYRIATNEAITFLENRKRLHGVSFDEVEHKLASALQSDPYFDGDYIQQALQTAIATLPEKQKAVFLLRYYDELPYQEISEITGTSVGGLKASYHHAVKKIEAFISKID
jgi:RNA polymerase sigma-70 factor (ECF subfamily)